MRLSAAITLGAEEIQGPGLFLSCSAKYIRLSVAELALAARYIGFYYDKEYQ
jgi:hypothetical protein